MTGAFSGIAGRGEKITVYENGLKRQARAFIEPVSVTSPEKAEMLPAGLADGRRYLLIAAPDAISAGGSGTEIGCGGKRYEILRCELIGGSHWEGVMRLKAGDGNA